MLPDGRLRALGLRERYLRPDNVQGYARRIDFERGAGSIGDATLGLDYQNWRLYYVPTTYEVRLADEKGFDRAMFQSAGLTQLSLAFDFNMRPVIAYQENGLVWLRRFNTAGAQTEKLLIPSAKEPRLALDDKRQAFSAGADVTLFYLRADNLCVRYQRENFSTEHVKATGVVGTRLGRVGMTTGWRVQVELLP